ncbi:MAG: tryptophan halogenase [Ponticaulis sp.]|nr:tryptophan halogenase [Ponticaulis sp.]|tara:strand:+ start:6858 stop:8348 length:1491 start_codon:yes stop_codon:yes gene_type:complete
MLKNILIVGGGSAGWITANLLNHFIQRFELPCQITLVESPDIPTIGVGEATVPSIRRTMSLIGIAEGDLMASSEATFKCLIRFENWNDGQSYDHPFDRRHRTQTDPLAEAWTAQNGKDFDRTFSVLTNLADHNIAPKSPQTPQYLANFPYAYHLDAIKMALRLAEFGRSKGILHKRANITEANVSPEGLIESVETDQGETLSADLFVDCTGFRSVLMGGALGVGVKDYSKYLLCDRAVTMRVPYEVHKPERIVTYTRSIARDHGWQWDINLHTRRGLGYVYSSQFLSDDEAEASLRKFEGPHTDGLSAGRLKFASIQRKQAWKGNCVAIGLSAGFLEPLESSGLYMIEFAAQMLGNTLIDYINAPAAAQRNFNRNMDDLYEEVMGFINLHYVTSTRRDTEFWRAATSQEAIWDGLQDKLEIWRNRSPIDYDFHGSQRLFALDSFEFVLHGMKWVNPPPRGNYALPDHSELLAQCRQKLPTHEQFLELLIRSASQAR